VLGTLLAAGRPLTAAEVLAAIHAAGATPRRWEGSKADVARISDMLGYQVRAGRVERVGRGRYVVVEASMSPTTLRRCRRWADALTRSADDLD